jgi:monovalent cation:H+ antiporter-2, CPA2 family
VRGWTVEACLLLAGITCVSSSGIVAKLLDDLGRVGNRETPVVLGLLVFEDLAMAVLLPLAAILVVDQPTGAALGTIAVALVVAAAAVLAALVARGEFSILLAQLGVGTGLEPDLAPLAAAYVLVCAISAPLLARAADPAVDAWLARRPRHVAAPRSRGALH